MFEGKRQIWCNVDDDYRTVSYDEDTPCRKSGKLFLLKDATREDGDFEIYTGRSWSGPVAVESRGATYREQMFLNFYFPVENLQWGRVSDETLKKIRKAIEKALETDEFKQEVAEELSGVKLSVVDRTNAYYGD